MTVAALSFLHDRTTKNARRMFHISLLYLPVFMSGLLLHRLPNDRQESMLPQAIKANEELLVSEAQDVLGDENSSHHMMRARDQTRAQPHPPVAFASVAPFPFLPAPVYVSADL